MTAALIGVASAIGLLLTVAWWYLNRPPSVLQRVIVNLKSEPELAVSGVLWQVRGPWLVFKDVTMLRSDGKTTPFDGECQVHRSNVGWIQVPPPADR
jgi:hypothetical protein